MILEATDIRYRSSDGTALIDGMSLTVGRGDIVAVAGPNGAGKTTLLKLLAGLLPTESGEIRLFGTPIHALSMRQRAERIAFLSQRDEPDGRLSMEEYVALGRIPHQHKLPRSGHRRAIDAAIAAVGLTHKRGAPLAQLSGGEAQRAAIARALSQEPEILFLDEPTNHLDPRAKGELLSLVASLGITIVCVLHDLTLIPALATHVVLVESGAVAVEGSTGQALTCDTVKQVFGVDFFELPHPENGRPLRAIDIPIHKSSQPSKELH